MINLNNKIKSPKLKKGGNKKKRKSPFSEKYKKFLNNENVDELISPQKQDTISPNISPDIKINVIQTLEDGNAGFQMEADVTYNQRFEDSLFHLN